jgi:polyisoprenoid-binding protein YceI
MRRRSFVSAAALLLLLPVLASAEVEKYKIDPAHTDVGFTVRHFVSKVPGHFAKFEGEVLLDPKDPSTMKITGKIDAASIDTNNEKRDNHLRSGDFFDAANHPEITFVSKKVAKAGDKWTVTGDLTIRGVTKEVPLEVEILGFMPDPWGNQRAGFEAHGKVNRLDFGVSWNKKLDQGGMMLSDDVELVLRVEAVKEAPQQAQK